MICFGHNCLRFKICNHNYLAVVNWGRSYQTFPHSGRSHANYRWFYHESSFLNLKIGYTHAGHLCNILSDSYVYENYIQNKISLYITYKVVLSKSFDWLWLCMQCIYFYILHISYHSVGNIKQWTEEFFFSFCCRRTWSFCSCNAVINQCLHLCDNLNLEDMKDGWWDKTILGL